jgi:hypothetical protein
MNSVVGYATFVTGLQLENKGPKVTYVALLIARVSLLVASCCPPSSPSLLLPPPPPPPPPPL